MANVVCDEDKLHAAVCCCICRFPLPNLCESHLEKHAIDTENFSRFEHFYLPLQAAQLINSKQLKDQMEVWLFKLHKAYGVLKGQLQDIDRFETQIEAAKDEAVRQLQDHASTLKTKVREMRERFAAELDAAIQDTQAHCIEQWTPGSGSLASCIWNYDANYPGSLEFVKLRVETANLEDALQVAIESTLPALSQFGHVPVSENEKLKMKIQELVDIQENFAAAHKQEITDLNEKYSSEVESLKNKHQTEQYRLEKEAQELQATVSVLEETIADQKSQIEVLTARYEFVVRTLCEELRQVKPDIELQLLQRGLELQAQSRYEESCGVLQAGWLLASQRPTGTAIALHLAEVMGLHLGKFAEASAVVDAALQVATSFNPTSEDALHLNNVRAALYYHSGNDVDCITVSQKALQTFFNADANSLLTALYYLTFAYWNVSYVNKELETMIDEWLKKKLKGEGEMAELLRLCAKGRRANGKGNSPQAENELIQAEQIAFQSFPTSIYSAMNSYFLGRVYNKLNRREEERVKHSKAEETFAAHFPNSIWHALNLAWLSDLQKAAGQLDTALSLRLRADIALRTQHRTNILYATNLTTLAELQRAMGNAQVALSRRLQAERIYKLRHPSLINRALDLSNMADLLRDLGQSHAAVQRRLEAAAVYEAHPANINRPLNLINLAELLRSLGKKEEAANKRIQADAMLKEHHATQMSYPLNITNLADLYQDMGNTDKALKKRLKADAIFKQHHSANINYPLNLAKIANLLRDLGRKEEAMVKRIEADAVNRAHHLSHINTSTNLANLGTLCKGMGRLDDAERYHLQAKELLEAHHPMTNEAATNLHHLAQICEARGAIDSAIQYANLALTYWKKNKCEKAESLAQPTLARLHSFLKEEVKQV